MKKLLALILALAMIIAACSTLASCDQQEQTETGSDTAGATEQTSDTVTETDSQSNELNTDESSSDTADTTESETMIDENADVIYGNGADITEAGAKWESGFFANVKHEVDESKAVDITAAELLARMVNRDGDNALKDGEVFRVSDTIYLESAKYYGNGAAIIAEGGIVIKNAVDVVLKDIIIKGSLTIKNSVEIIFYKVDIDSDATTVTIDGNSSDITFKTCRFRGNDASVVSEADDVVLYRCYVYSHGGLDLAGDNVVVQNCRIFASLNAVSVSGSDCVVRENSIEAVSSGSGVTVNEGSQNALVALNVIRGVQKSITVNDSFNCAVVLNSAVSLSGASNTNLYVIDNKLGGYMKLENNNYIIAEGNSYPVDGLNHTVIQNGNQNKNGNSITDVNARVDVGANEDLLPHTNKELFVGMNRKSAVADASLTTAKSLGGYIQDLSKQQELIIVPPGAYVSNSPIAFRTGQDNTTIYAYGVYQEYAETDPAKVDNLSLDLVGVNNVAIYGITVGHTLPSSGQVRIVEKFKEGTVYKLKVIADAGFLDGFTTTNPEIYHTWWPEFFLTGEDGTQNPYPEENAKTRHKTEYNKDENGNYDGTMTITLLGNGNNEYSEYKSAKQLWDRLEVGNVITCRINYAAHRESTGSLIRLVGCSNLTFRDTVTYGSAGGMCVFTGNNREGITFTRQHNTTHSESVIDKATYDKYVALEEKYGVDFEVREEKLEDGTVRYRGPYSRSGSVDAFHVTTSKTGINITSSLLEGMVDDGSNQKSNSSRLHGYKDNGDGTTTLYYKNLISQVYWNNSTALPSNQLSFSSCKTFSEGDRIYIFTPQGRTVCDTTVIKAWTEQSADASAKKGVEINETYGGVNKHLWIDLYAVTVKTKDVDFDAFTDPTTGKAFDLTDNGYETTNRLSVDNLSWNCCNYTLDNVMVRNGHSRGFLVKATGVTIKHCTFRNVSNAGLLITIEPQYGETTVARDVMIQQCLFDHTGYNYNAYKDRMQSCIVIKAESTVVSENTLPIDDITITGCKFTNNTQITAIWINSAKNIKVTNNIFDPIVNERLQDPGTAVYLDKCMNVEISDNTYNFKSYVETGNIKTAIRGTNYKNIFGTDVTDAEDNPIFPDNITAK